MAKNNLRYSIGRGGDDEPGLILILDHKTHTIIARSSEMAMEQVRELVNNANTGDYECTSENYGEFQAPGNGVTTK